MYVHMYDISLVLKSKIRAKNQMLFFFLNRQPGKPSVSKWLTAWLPLLNS